MTWRLDQLRTLNSATGHTVARVGEAFYEHNGIVDHSDCMLQLTIENGATIVLSSSSDGAPLCVSDKPWMDPFAEPLSDENREFVRKSGKWRFFCEANMYEFHGWLGLAESTGEREISRLQPIIDELKTLLAGFVWPNVNVTLLPLNGTYFLTIIAYVNRQRSEAEQIEGLIHFISERLPGSWGLLYERDDETTAPPGSNAFRVRTIARGRIEEHTDPFLSPCRPTIED